MEDVAKLADAAAGLSKAQREALAGGEWISPGGQTPFVVVDFVGPWPEGVAQFFTLRSDRLTPLGLALRDHLERNPQP